MQINWSGVTLWQYISFKLICYKQVKEVSVTLTRAKSWYGHLRVLSLQWWAYINRDPGTEELDDRTIEEGGLAWWITFSSASRWWIGHVHRSVTILVIFCLGSCRPRVRCRHNAPASCDLQDLLASAANMLPDTTAHLQGSREVLYSMGQSRGFWQRNSRQAVIMLCLCSDI